MHTGKQKQMNASSQTSLVNRHIRRFTGVISQPFSKDTDLQFCTHIHETLPSNQGYGGAEVRSRSRSRSRPESVVSTGVGVGVGVEVGVGVGVGYSTFSLFPF